MDEGRGEGLERRHGGRYCGFAEAWRGAEGLQILVNGSLRKEWRGRREVEKIAGEARS